jgi:tetratricopeptide (TPR) repeat protein/outer membrane protein assembly factor BamD (BamD/ComL family)
MPEMDYSKFKVLLIGASEFPADSTIHAIPNIRKNIQLLKECLTDERFIGVPEDNIIVSFNENSDQIERKLWNIAEQTRNKEFTLLVYYSGHGILSSEDFQLYLTTSATSKKYLEIDGININKFKSHIKRSYAGRKIVILDCCHSGQAIETMGDIPGTIQASLTGFEGTYVMTSSSEDEPSTFPSDPNLPTYFTGKLIEIVTNGLEIEDEYCSLRDIFDKIKSDFSEKSMPLPQQSNFNNAQSLYFSKNIKFSQKKTIDELQWEQALKKNTLDVLIEFIQMFPTSVHTADALQKIEEQHWKIALERNTIFSYAEYLKNYPNGLYAEEAKKGMDVIKLATDIQQEETHWNEAIRKNDISSYENYCRFYPKGKYVEEAKRRISELKEKILQAEEIFWHKVLEENEIEEYEKYCSNYPHGIYVNDAKNKIDQINAEIEIEKQKRKEQEEEDFWNKAVRKNKIEFYEKYCSIYPNGKYTEQANEKIIELKNAPRQKTLLDQVQILWNEAKNILKTHVHKFSWKDHRQNFTLLAVVLTLSYGFALWGYIAAEGRQFTTGKNFFIVIWIYIILMTAYFVFLVYSFKKNNLNSSKIVPLGAKIHIPVSIILIALSLYYNSTFQLLWAKIDKAEESANNLFNTGDYESSWEAATEINYSVTQTQLNYLAGRACILLGIQKKDSARVEQALNYLERHFADGKDSLAACWYYRGMGLSFLKKNEDAKAAFTEAIQLNPKFEQAYKERGALYFNMKNYGNSILDYNQAIALDSSDAISFNNLGIAEYYLGSIKQAISNYNKAIELDSANPGYYYNRATATIASENYREAIPDYNKAIELNSNDGDFYYGRGAAYFYLKNYEKVFPDYKKAVQLDPYNADFLNGFATINCHIGKYKESIGYYDQAILLEPAKGDFYCGRGAAKYYLGIYRESILDYNKAIELDSKNGEYYNGRGNAKRAAQNQFGDPCEDFQKAAALGNGEGKANCLKYNCP